MTSQIEKEKVKQEIRGLIEKYNEIEKEKRVNKYNEEMTKAEFIEPLFEALGWDVRNRTHRNEVSREEKISKKRVDYGFRINGIPKFFLEAKALKADLDNPAFADQAINYAWHKSCTWAILTDFENIKLFNAEWKTTELFQSMFFSLNCQQFLERFDQLWLLSKEGFEQSLLDKEAEKWGKKSKKNPVGEQLLNDLTKWRTDISKDILKRNMKKKLTQDELDEAIQRIIDRLIFIRNCEDRELEPITLLSTMREWDDKGRGALFEYIIEVFGHFDVEYNSKLFQHHLCDDLDIGNRVLEEIINDLYHTKDKTIKYDFSALDADILGNVYEQYLSHILKKTAKRATLTERYAYRKEQGIYYTPTYVVDYIVRNTLGEILEKKVDVEKIRVLDPTCGSGSFLIKAFDVLSEYYLRSDKHYVQTKLDFDTRITFKRKTKILKNNIFGVDLDKRAVEIAQLNLLLKITEKRQELPLLEQNIKCGNSLIDDKIAGDKAFKWKEKFASIINEGGFDVIIGNPPYVHQKGEKDSPMIDYKEREYYRKNYESLSEEGGTTRGGVKLNLFIPYVERCIKLLKEHGKMGFIVHKNILKVESYKFLRKFILRNCAIEKIVDLGAGVFKDVTGETVIIILRKESDNKKRKDNIISVIYGLSSESDLSRGFYSINKITQRFFETTTDSMFSIYMNPKIISIRSKIERNSVILEDAVKIVSFGLNTSNNKKYFIKEKLNKKYKKAVMGRDIEKWVIKNRNKFVYYDPEVLTRTGDEQAFLSKEKLIMQRIGAALICAYDSEQYYCYNSTNMILSKGNKFNLKYILALLNSDLLNAYYRIVFGIKAGLTVNVTQGYLSQLPVKKISDEKQKEIINIVNGIIRIKRRELELKNKEIDEKIELKEKLDSLESSINNLIFEIYGITESEKKIIEDSLK